MGVGGDMAVQKRPQARSRRAKVRGSAADRASWVRELRALQRSYKTPKVRLASEAILAELREDRV